MHIVFVTRFGKTDHVAQKVKRLLLLHIIDTFIHYSKHSDKITRGGQVCFSTWLFLGHAKHWKASTDGVGPLGGFKKMAWTQMVSYMLAPSSVLVCAHHLPALYKRYSWYYSCASKRPKSSKTSYQRWSGLSTWS